MKIDFVSDVACPWCAVGLNALERALALGGPDCWDVDYDQTLRLTTVAARAAYLAAVRRAKRYIRDGEEHEKERDPSKYRDAAGNRCCVKKQCHCGFSWAFSI